MNYKSNFRKLFESFKRDVTGPSLFDYRLYLLILPIFVATSILANVTEFTFFEVFYWLVANLLTIALCALVMWLVDKTLFGSRDVKRTALSGVLFFSAVLGAAKGAGTSIMAALLGAANTSPELSLSRTIQTSLLGLITIPALAVLSANFQRFEEERGALIAQLARAESLDPTSSAQLRGAVDRLRKAIVDLSDSASNYSSRELPPLLRDVVTAHLRPLTLNLWVSQRDTSKKFTFTKLARAALVSHPFPALPVGLILAAGSFLPYLMASGLREASLRTAITGAVIFLAFSALSRLRVKKFWAATIIFFAGNLFTAGAIVAVSTIAFGSLQGQPAPQAFAVLFIWIAQTAFMTSFFQSATNTRQEVRDQLARIAGQLNVNADVLRLRNQIAAREYANHLHSNVQNQLLSLALRVESGQGIRVEEELSDIERLLDAATFHIEVSSLKEALESMSQRWLGFAKVDLDVELTCPVCEPSETLQRLASEALNNAVRHGLAQTISISARCDGFAAHFTVIDDGIGPKVEAVEGLGTKFFESISDGNWSLEPHDEGGSILKIRVPHERQ